MDLSALLPELPGLKWAAPLLASGGWMAIAVVLLGLCIFLIWQAATKVLSEEAVAYIKQYRLQFSIPVVVILLLFAFISKNVVTALLFVALTAAAHLLQRRNQGARAVRLFALAGVAFFATFHVEGRVRAYLRARADRAERVFVVASFEVYGVPGPDPYLLPYWSRFRDTLNGVFDSIPSLQVQPKTLDATAAPSLSVKQQQVQAVVKHLARSGINPDFILHTMVNGDHTGGRLAVVSDLYSIQDGTVMALGTMADTRGHVDDIDYEFLMISYQLVQQLRARRFLDLEEKEEQAIRHNVLRDYVRILRLYPDRVEAAHLDRAKASLAAATLEQAAVTELLALYKRAEHTENASTRDAYAKKVLALR